MESSIGIVGSGVSGLHLGLFLLANDVPVTMYAQTGAGRDPAGSAAEHRRPPPPHARARARAGGPSLGRGRVWLRLPPPLHRGRRGSAIPRRLHRPVVGHRLPAVPPSPDGGLPGARRRAGARAHGRRRGGQPPVIAARPHGGCRRAGRDRRAVPAARRQVPLRPTAAPAVGRDLQRHHLLRAEGRQHPFLARPRRAPRAAHLLARRVRDSAALRGHPRWRRRGARSSPVRRGPGRLRPACAREAAPALPDGLRTRRSRRVRAVVRAATSCRARSLRSSAGLRAPGQRAVCARRWRLPRRGRPADGTGREFGLVLRLDDRRSDRRGSRVRRALLRARGSAARGVRNQRLRVDEPDAQPAAARARVHRRDGEDKALCDEFTTNFNHPDKQVDVLGTPERTRAFLGRAGRPRGTRG